MDTKEMDDCRGWCYFVWDMEGDTDIDLTAAPENPVLFFQYPSTGLNMEVGWSKRLRKDGSENRFVCVDCVALIRGNTPRLLGILDSYFPYVYVKDEVESHPELEHLSMEDGGKWLYYHEIEREHLVCSNCDEVFLTYWPETRKVGFIYRDQPYLSIPVAVSRGRVKIWMEKMLDTQASSPLEECHCYDCGRVFLVSDDDSGRRFLKHDC